MYDILHGDSKPTSPRMLTPEGREAIKVVEDAIQMLNITLMDYSQPLKFRVGEKKKRKRKRDGVVRELVYSPSVPDYLASIHCGTIAWLTNTSFAKTLSL